MHSTIYLITFSSFLMLTTINSETGKLPDHCGQRNNSSNSSSMWRIAGGKESAIGEWPWQAYIKIHGILSGSMEFNSACSGTLIHERWILTAAHCFFTDSNEKDITVYLGVHDLKQITAPNETVVKSSVDKVIMHEEFNYFEEKNDIALLKIHERMDFANKHNFLHPICVASNSAEPQKKCFTSGWGDTNADGAHTTLLMKVEIPIFNLTKCEISFPKVTKEQNICAGGTASGGTGTCRGDSGGPLQCETDADGKWYQIGITSVGKPCARPDIPDVFTRVSHYRDWIEKTILNNV